MLAHECGHRGFSNSTLLCDTVGYVLHSLLLVPYFSWQYSHAKHHGKTNHLLDGETHVPASRKYQRQFQAIHDTVGEDAFAIWELVAHLLFGPNDSLTPLPPLSFTAVTQPTSTRQPSVSVSHSSPFPHTHFLLSVNRT